MQSRDDGDEDEPLMIAPLLPLPRPRCAMCPVEFPRHAYVTGDMAIHWYCDDHWEDRPDEHRDARDDAHD